jgi:S-adenosylmethionine:tRNA ribosyltransferase-isomerase
MKLSEFDYPLSHDRIAQHPLPERDQSRLLVYDRKSGQIRHRSFPDLVRFLKPSDVLVVNNSRVWPARFSAKKIPTGGRVEVLLIAPLSDGGWDALVQGKPSSGQLLRIGESTTVRIQAALGSGRFRLDGLDDGTIKKVSHRFGKTPLPPYIHRENGVYEIQDRQRYQTVYAEKEGSIAAPTAGLHFTEDLLKQIREIGIKIITVTLHIGPGTFRPVRAESIFDHRMEPERFEVSAQSIRFLLEAKQSGSRIVAVGTSSVRVLESLNLNDFKEKTQHGHTGLFIFPGFQFKMVDALVTNFHLPRSTLLMLVAAFAGLEPLLEVYRDALARRYRFASYGDAMLIL